MTITLPEQTKGVGGSYSWQDKDGIGTMKTTAAEPYKSITQTMQFADFPASDISWGFAPRSNNTTDVTWTAFSKNMSFTFKLKSYLKGGMEKQIAPHYERSLEKLDSIAQASMKVYSITVNGIRQHSGGFYLYNTTSCRMDELADKMRDMLPNVSHYVAKNNITMAGAPYVNYHKWDEENNAVIFSCCIPTTEKVIAAPNSGILTGQLKPFKALKTTLKGDYKNLKEAWDTAMKHIQANGLVSIAQGPTIETYLTDAIRTSNPADYITEIYIAVK